MFYLLKIEKNKVLVDNSDYNFIIPINSKHRKVASRSGGIPDTAH